MLECSFDPANLTSPRGSGRVRRLRPLLPLLAIVALAAFFRLYRLDHVPPGLFGDEAANGVEATAILRGERFPIYIEEPGPAKWGSREALYHYAMAGVFAVFGGSPTTIRLTSALLGILTVALFFPLARRWLGPRAGFFAAGLFAVSRWHVTASRLGLRAILVPLFVVLVLLAFSALATSRKWRWALLLGVLTGLGFYTYPSYWAVPPALCLVGFAAYRAGSPSRGGLGLALCTVLVAVAVAAPLLGYALRRPDYFFGRTANVLQIHASNGHADSLRDHVQGVLFSLHLRGDENPRHNIPLAPLLDPITGVLFLIGLYRLLRHFDRASPVHVALLAFLLLPLVPEALGDAAPHALRGLGALPAIFAICGLVFGLPEAARAASSPLKNRWRSEDEEFCARSRRRTGGKLAGFVEDSATKSWRKRPARSSRPVFQRAARSSRRGVALSLLGLAAVAAWNYDGYFHRWAQDPALPAAFNTGALEFARHCADLAASDDVYASPEVYAIPQLRFLRRHRAGSWHRIRSEKAFAAPGGAQRDRVYISDSPAVHRAIESVYPKAKVVGRYTLRAGMPGRIYRVKRDDLESALSRAQRDALRRWIAPGQPPEAP